MNAKPGSWRNLQKGTIERACARIERIATANTIHGGASAMVMANRAAAMGLPNAGELQDTVAAVYSRSSGRMNEQFGAWCCGECGSTHAGRDAADECCGECWEEFDLAEEMEDSEA